MEENTGIITKLAIYCFNGMLKLAKKYYFANLTVFQNYDDGLLEYYFHTACVGGSITVARYILQMMPTMNNPKTLYYTFHECHLFHRRKPILFITQLQPQNVWHYHNYKTKKTKYIIYTKKQKVAKQM
jgi:hypothetical protein